MAELRAMTGAEPLGGEEDDLEGRVCAAGTDARGRSAIAGGASVPIAELLEAVLAQSGYIEALEAERSIEAQGRIENLEQLVEVGREFDEGEDEGTLERFLQEIALVADADTRSDDEGLVTLMTLHNAKGLEYPTVFITGSRTASSRTRARSTRAAWRRSAGCSTSASRARCASST